MLDKNIKQKLEIEVKTTDLDEAIEKVNRLVELLREAQHIIDLLSHRQELES